MSWVLIWRGNWMTRDSSLSLPHESAEFSWLVPPTTADYRRWAGYGQLSEAHSSFCVSISSSGQQFQGVARTTHRPTLQSKGLYGGNFLMGIWSRGGLCEPNQPINGYSSFLATCNGVLLRQWQSSYGHMLTVEGFALARLMTCLKPAPCKFAYRRQCYIWFHWKN